MDERRKMKNLAAKKKEALKLVQVKQKELKQKLALVKQKQVKQNLAAKKVLLTLKRKNKDHIPFKIKKPHKL